jgi:hypothetical protein
MITLDAGGFFVCRCGEGAGVWDYSAAGDHDESGKEGIPQWLKPLRWRGGRMPRLKPWLTWKQKARSSGEHRSTAKRLVDVEILAYRRRQLQRLLDRFFGW